MNHCYRLVWSALNRCWVAVAECARARGKTARAGAVLAVVAGNALAAPPAATQLPTGGQVTAGQASVATQGSAMIIQQGSQRAVIDWQRFDIGSQASVNIAQPSSSSVLLNRVLGSDPSQIYGRLSANGQVFLSNAAGVYFSPTASVDVGGLVATTHGIANADFMAGAARFGSTGGSGSIVNEGSLTAASGGYVVLAAPTVRNTGLVTAQLGTAALAAGDGVELQFDGARGLADVRVAPAALAALVDNGGAVVAPGGRILLSAQAADRLQGGVVQMSGRLEANALTQDGGVIRLVASDAIAFSGSASADAGQQGKGGSVTVIADLANPDSRTRATGTISARGGAAGGDGGFVETSASHVDVGTGLHIDTRAAAGRSGLWLIDPYDYVIDATAAANIVAALASTNVEVLTSANVAGYGSTGNAAGSGNITVNSAIAGGTAHSLTLTAANQVIVNAAIAARDITLNGPGGIQLGHNLTARNDITLNGNVTLTANVQLTSGISNVYTSYTDYVVPAGETSVTAILLGGAGGIGGNDGGNGANGVGTSTVGRVIASFAVTPGEHLYLAPGSGGDGGADSINSSAYGSGVRYGGLGGTNAFNLGNGGQGGEPGPGGYSGAGGGGGAASVLTRSSSPTAGSAMLVAAGGGGTGGSGNNSACPSLCGAQAGNNFRSDAGMDGQLGAHAANTAPPQNDGGGSGGGGGGIAGGLTSPSVFYVNEWTGRGGNMGSSGAANGFATTALTNSKLVQTSYYSGDGGSVAIVLGGGNITFNGTVDGSRQLTVQSLNGHVLYNGAVGASQPLATLHSTGSQGVALNAAGFTTSGAQSWTGPLTLGSSSVGLSGAGLDLYGDVGGTGKALTLSSGSGAVNVYGELGGSGAALGAVGIATTGVTTLGGAVHAASLDKTGNGRTNLDGSSVTTSGGQSYGGLINLGGATVLSSTGSGNVAIAGAVSNNSQNDLTISAAGGNVSVGGNFAVGTNSYGATPIGNVSLSASGSVTLGSSGSPIQADLKSLSITGGSANVYASTTGFTCGGLYSVSGVCTTQGQTYDVGGASAASGPLSGPGSLTKQGGGKLTLTGANRYTGDTNVAAGILELGGSGTLGTGGNYGGNISVTGQLRDASSANQTLGGAISGTGFINNKGSGTLAITTLANAGSYNLVDVYLRLSGSTSSSYGSTPSFQYGLYTDAGATTALTGATPTGTAAFSGVSATTGAGSHAVSYTSGLSFASERYVLGTGAAGNWTVNAAVLSLSATKTYDGGAGVEDYLQLGGTLNGDTLPALGGYGAVNASSANTGSYSISTSGFTLNNANYALPANFTATITKAQLTVTADGQTRLYGQANPTLTQTVSGFVNGENLGSAGVTGTALGSTTAGVASGVGSYAITGSTGTLASTNYNFVAADGTLTINKAHLTVTADNQSRLYGQASPVLTQTVSGFVNGETLATAGISGSALASSGANTTSGVGSYLLYGSTGTLAAANYDFTPANGTLTINKAHLTVTPSAQSRVYGEANPVFTQQISGYLFGQDAASAGITGEAFASSTATAASGAGQYVIQGGTGTLSAANYDFVPAAATLTVDKAQLTVTADSLSRLYGQANPALTHSFSGFVNGDTLATAGISGSATASTGATTSSGVGSYAINAGTGTLASANYVFTPADGMLTINKAHLTVKADDQARLYGQANPALTQTITGFVNGETAATAGITGSASASTAATTVTGVGSHAITGSAGTFSAANYDFITADGTLTINKAHLTVKADDQARLYGQTNPALTQTITGFVNGETLATAGITGSASANTAATTATGVGSYAIAGSVGSLNAANYDFSATGGTLTIAKAHLTVKADDRVRLYGQANPALTQTITGFVNGETAATAGITGSASASSAATAATGAGAHAIGASTGSLVAANYDFTPANGTLTINKAHLTVTPDDQTRLFGQANPAFTQTLTGFVNGETLASAGVSGSALGSSSATLATAPGQYAIAGATGSLAAANYDFVAGTGRLTINPGVEPPVVEVPGGAQTAVPWNVMPTKPNIEPPSPAVDMGSMGTMTAFSSTQLPVVDTLPGVLPVSPLLGSLPANVTVVGAETFGGIVVSALQLEGVPKPSVVTAVVPKDMATSGSGFSFPLPAQAMSGVGADVLPTASTLAGEPLPGWLSFDSRRRVFTASAVPDGALPMNVRVRLGETELRVEISAGDR